MKLEDLQRGFLRHLLDEPSAIADVVTVQGTPGLAVYHHAYAAQLTASLKDRYERLWAWLGDDAFDAAARRHIAHHPPHSWTLAAYGPEFAATIEALYPDDPEVTEIAALDWALRRAFDGPDAEPLAPSALSGVNWDEAVLHFVPTLDLIPVSTNCGAIWTAISSGEDVPPAQRLPCPGWIRVWRADLQPSFATIEADELAAVQLVTSGVSFSRLCDRMAEEIGVEAAVERAGRYLATWLQDQLIAEIA